MWGNGIGGPGIPGLGRWPLAPNGTWPGGGSITGAPTAGAWPPGYTPVGCWTGCPGMGTKAGWPVIGPCCPCCIVSPLLTLVMSWMLDRRLSLLIEFKRMKYFCAWLATCVGVLEITKFLDMLRQSPFPNFANPSKKSLEITQLTTSPQTPQHSWVSVNHTSTSSCSEQQSHNSFL